MLGGTRGKGQQGGGRQANLHFGGVVVFPTLVFGRLGPSRTTRSLAFSPATFVYRFWSQWGPFGTLSRIPQVSGIILLIHEASLLHNLCQPRCYQGLVTAS